MEVEDLGQPWVTHKLRVPMQSTNENGVPYESFTLPINPQYSDENSFLHWQLLSLFTDNLFELNFPNMTQYSSGTRCIIRHMFYQGEIRSQYQTYINLLQFVNEDMKRNFYLKKCVKEMFPFANSSMVLDWVRLQNGLIAS